VSKNALAREAASRLFGNESATTAPLCRRRETARNWRKFGECAEQFRVAASSWGGGPVTEITKQ